MYILTKNLCFSCARMWETSALFSLPLKLFNLLRLKHCHRSTYVALWVPEGTEQGGLRIFFSGSPKEPVKHKAWKMNVGRKEWHSTDAFVLFLEHFTPDSYNNDLSLLTEFGIPVKKLKLRPDAMPKRQPCYFFFYRYPVQKASSSKGSAKARIAQNP